MVCSALSEQERPLDTVLDKLKEHKASGASTEELFNRIKYGVSKSTLHEALAAASQHNLNLEQVNHNLRHSITSFVNVNEFKMYSPYFMNLKDYTHVDYCREQKFLEKAMELIKKQIELHEPDVVELNAHVKETIEIMSKILYSPASP